MPDSIRYSDAIKRVYYADVSERYEEMCQEILEVIKIAREENIELNQNVRNYFSSAFKNIVSRKRSSYRLLNSEKTKNPGDAEIIDRIIGRIVEELMEYTGMVLETLEHEEEIKKIDNRDSANANRDSTSNNSNNSNNNSSNTTSSCSSSVFLLKMKGDYLRYRAEVQAGDVRNETVADAQRCYQKSTELARGLSSTDPMRLGLALNYSVFHYEILSDAEEACKIAKEAFEVAISDLDSLGEETYKDSTLIMQLLRDNLTLWTTRNEVKKPE